MEAAATTVPSLLVRVSCAPAQLAWSWVLTTRPARFRASAPSISSAASAACRRRPLLSAPAMKAGRSGQMARAARALVRERHGGGQDE